MRRPGGGSVARNAVARKFEQVIGDSVLPVTDWEKPDARVTLPDDLRTLLGLSSAVLRVSADKHKLILSQHPRDIECYLNLSEHLGSWIKAGRRRDSPNWSVYYRISERWYVAIVGPDRNGSWNLITHWSTPVESKMERRWNQEEIVENE